MNQAFHAENPDFYRIFDSAQANAQFFLLYNLSGDPRRFDEVADDRRSRANLRVFLKAGNHRENEAFFNWLEIALSEYFPNANVTLGGEAYVIHNWMSGVGIAVFVSVILTFLVMLAIASFFLRSVIGGLILMIPVTVGVLLTYAYIGYTAVPVGLGTGSFAAIAIGVGVDFAIHYLWKYRNERRSGLTHRSATQRVMEEVGKAISFNGFIVIGGFLVLILATTLPPQQIGMYVAICVAGSLVTTFVILSVVTRWWKIEPRTRS